MWVRAALRWTRREEKPSRTWSGMTPTCAYGDAAYLRICVRHGGREGELETACGVWVRCSQAGSGRRSVGDGVAEAEKVGQEGKKAGGGGGVPCGGAATGQYLLES